MPVSNALLYLAFLPLAASSELKSESLILTATLERPSIEANGFLPILNPGTLSAIREEIIPLYFFDCFAGITASPGESIAGTTSPAPLGPGTDIIPEARFSFGLVLPIAPPVIAP